MPRFSTIIIALLIHLSSMLNGQQNEELSLFGTVGFGQLFPHKKEVQFLKKGQSYTFEIDLKQNNSRNNSGFCLHGQTNGNPVLGQAFGLYSYQQRKIISTRKLFFKIGLGVAYLNRPFDPNNNVTNIAIGSKINANIHLGLSRQWNSFQMGFGLIHFSNGSFKTPNLGLNFWNFNLGFRLSDKINIATRQDTSSVDLKNWELTLLNGWRENKAPGFKKYWISSLGIRRFIGKKNYRISIQLDGFYNPGINHFGTSKNYFPFQFGLGFGNHFLVNKTTYELAIVKYLYEATHTEGWFYHKLACFRSLNSAFSIGVTLKSHWAVAESFLLTLIYKW